ncbi:MAG: FGGY family carbohydrate kinase [Bacteroidia bacterium]|nr:FGGY family carbohydrate kinase [Bacteroidia bacterium]
MFAVFDIGKTNKKFLVFDENGEVVYEQSARFEEVPDEDGFLSDDLLQLRQWVKETLEKALNHKDLSIDEVNVSAYGASFVHIDRQNQVLTPLYNYLKPFPETLKSRFFEKYGPQPTFSTQTASPYLGMLNSGLQLFWLKYQQPGIFSRIHHSLHLPQYISFFLGGKPVNEITSTGCHTGLWDFSGKKIHHWVGEEKIASLFPPFCPSHQSSEIIFSGRKIALGPGIHDSSAALVPYLLKIPRHFILLSTGTWSIAMNPFNKEPLTEEELRRDVLSYLTYSGNPVKSARLFLGNEHDHQLARIADHFDTTADFSRVLAWKEEIFQAVRAGKADHHLKPATMEGTGPDPQLKNGDWDLSSFFSFEMAYYQLLWDLVTLQAEAIQLTDGSNPPGEIYIDGGFAKNSLFTRMMARVFPERKIYVAEMGQATALGASLVIRADDPEVRFPLTFRKVEA